MPPTEIRSILIDSSWDERVANLLFAIEPNSLRILYTTPGTDARSLGIDYPTLEHLPEKPHREVLEWLWNGWR